MEKKEKETPSLAVPSEDKVTLDVHTGTKVENFPETTKPLQGNYNPFDKIRSELEQDAEEAAKSGLEAKSSWKKYIFDFSNRNVALPDYLLSINGVGMFARKSLTCITGRAGQGKSQSLIPIVAAPLAQRELLGITPMRPIRHILWTDTEQEAWSISEKANRLLRLMGMPDFSPTPSNLTMLTTRQASGNKERLDVTKDAIEDINPDVVILVDYPGFNLKIARFLHDHPAVKWICYPDLPDDPDNALARKYLS